MNIFENPMMTIAELNMYFIPSLPSPLANNRASTYSGLLPVNHEVSFCNVELDSGTNIIIL